jgi:hypothetical protein
VDVVVEVTLTVDVESSAAVYVGRGEDGVYHRERFQGRAFGTIVGGAPFGLAPALEFSGQAIAQPLFGESLTLRAGENGLAEFVAEGDRVLEFEFVIGSWESYSRGSDVVLKPTAESWDAWGIATQDGFLAILDQQRIDAEAGLQEGQWATGAGVTAFLDESGGRPLIRANRVQMMVFTEAMTLVGAFEVHSAGKDPKYSWWLGAYELRPGAAQALEGALVATAYVSLYALQIAGEFAVACAQR